MDFTSGPFAPLAGYDQFILWELRSVKERNQTVWKKYPIDYRNMSVADAHNPEIWQSATNTSLMADMLGPPYGIGFVFTENDPFFFIDVDSCYINNQWSKTALEVLSLFPGAAIEISQSLRGLHIIGSGKCPTHGCKNISLGLELYTQGRFVALTGINAVGSAATDFSDRLPEIVKKYFTASNDPNPAPREWTETPVTGYTSVETDEQLIEKALKSSGAGSIFGGKCSFSDLWTGNTEALSRSYPDSSGSRPYDYSSADAALAQHLMFWTGGNCERTRTLMMKSALVREKYGREDYLYRTVSKAASNQKQYYSIRSNPPAGTESAPIPGGTVGYQYLNSLAQAEFFKGCVYVQDIHRIYIPSGDFLRTDQFNAVYGGYVFQIDDIGEKTTRKAWEAFTESQSIHFPKVQSSCFRPFLASGQIIKEEGRTLVNTYCPVEIRTIKGNTEPFITHLEKVLPDERDQEILVSYMAACVQHIGVKFQWAPLLQGTEGNGKTLFTRCVAYAIGRKYTHYPKAMDIDNKFNGWLLNKLFIGVEDVYVPDHRREVIETLKPMITGGDGLEIQFKGQDQITVDICANFMLNSNHRDAIKKTRTDRRFAVFFTAQQVDGDLSRDGMTGNYFPKLYDWLRREGYAIVADFLKTYKIQDKYNPATLCHRAPETSTTNAAIMAGMGRIEQEIMEAIEEGRIGFCGGWISSIAVDRLLTATRQERMVPPNKRRELLQSIGYDWHPALPQGRVNNPIIIDENKKPRLFIKQGSILSNLATPVEVVKYYLEAQGSLQSSGFPVLSAIG